MDGGFSRGFSRFRGFLVCYIFYFEKEWIFYRVWWPGRPLMVAET